MRCLCVFVVSPSGIPPECLWPPRIFQRILPLLGGKRLVEERTKFHPAKFVRYCTQTYQSIELGLQVDCGGGRRATLRRHGMIPTTKSN